MSEILTVMGLEAVTGVLLFLALCLLVAGGIGWRWHSWLRRLQFLAAFALCTCWANWILGSSLGPRFLHGSALAPGAGRTPAGAFVVVDQYGQPSEVSESEFRQRQRYETGSRQMPWYVTPPAVLLVLAGLLMGRTARPASVAPPGEA